MTPPNRPAGDDSLQMAMYITQRLAELEDEVRAGEIPAHRALSILDRHIEKMRAFCATETDVGIVAPVLAFSEEVRGRISQSVCN